MDRPAPNNPPPPPHVPPQLPIPEERFEVLKTFREHVGKLIPIGWLEKVYSFSYPKIILMIVQI